jgi:hypothetical protein
MERDLATRFLRDYNYKDHCNRERGPCCDYRRLSTMPQRRWGKL